MGKVNNLVQPEKDFDEIYINLARNSALWELAQEEFLRVVCQSLAESLQVEHIAIYLLNKEQTELQQLIHYSLSSENFSSGLSLKKANHPLYFESLNAFRIIDAPDAQSDIRTREFSKSYLTPQGIGAMLECTLHHGGKLTGVVCAEHIGRKRVWNEDEKYFLISVSDLISQRLLYDELRSSSVNYSELTAFDEALVNTSSFCILSLDKNGNIKTINQTTSDLLGYAQHDLLGKNFFSSIIQRTDSSDSGTFDVSALRKKITSAKSISSDAYFKHRNGQQIPVSITITTLKDSDGHQKGYVCTAADISHMINTRQALEEKEERYRFVFEGSGDSMLLLQNDTFTDCNQATLKLFACTQEQILQQTPYRFSPEFQPDGRRSEEKALEKITAAMQGETQFFEWVHCRYDGTQFDAEVTLNSVQMHGDPSILASVRDISARKNSENELALSRKKILEHNENLALINTLSNQLHSTDSIDEIYYKTMQTLEWMPLSPRVAIYTVDEKAGVLHFKEGLGHEPGTENKFRTIPLNPDFSALALETGEPIYSAQVKTDDRLLPEFREKILDIGIQSLVEIPFVYHDRKMAVAILSYEVEHALSPENLDVLYSIGKTVSLAIVNAVSRSELGYIAHHDSLTDLANRAYFHKQFKSTILKGHHEHAALYLLDLDRFKEINDTLGHFTGDKVLQQIGPRLNALITEHEFMVSRLGGDEFILLVYGVGQISEAENIAKGIIDCLRAPFPIDDLNLEIDTSVGIALYPKDGMDSHALLRSADVAMYQAKHMGTGFAFYAQDTDIHTPERLAMIAEMGGSITSGQLFLHYQPKIDLQSNAVVGFEALARWDHPRLGLLGPSMFVPLIEMSNSIYQLTEEVLHQALSQQMQWRKDGYDYSIAVNLSARNLIDDRIIELITELLVIYDTPPEKLELEITETALMHDAYRATAYLKQISDLGVQLSIDDFGTGYSSLAYLNNLPIHKLKLDREFIMGMLNNQQGAAIVETIIALSKTLDLDVIAEGVEDKNTLDQLREMKCDQAQGYYICHPNSWEAIQHWLKRENKI